MFRRVVAILSLSLASSCTLPSEIGEELGEFTIDVFLTASDTLLTLSQGTVNLTASVTVTIDEERAENPSPVMFDFSATGPGAGSIIGLGDGPSASNTRTIRLEDDAAESGPVTFEVVASFAGKDGRDDQSARVVLNRPPTLDELLILSPKPMDSIPFGTPVKLRAEASDEDQGDSVSFDWKLDGESLDTSGTGFAVEDFRTDSSFVSELTLESPEKGVRVVSVVATDGDAFSEADSVSFKIRNLWPKVSISPPEGSDAEALILVSTVDQTFTAAVTDGDDDESLIAGGTAWTLIGPGGDPVVLSNEEEADSTFTILASDALPNGPYELKAQVQDEKGAMGRDSITFNLIAQDPPEVTIKAPDGPYLEGGAGYTFQATPVGAAMVSGWESSNAADDVEETGGGAMITFNGEGTRWIKVTVKEGSLSNSDSVQVRVFEELEIATAEKLEEASVLQTVQYMVELEATGGSDKDNLSWALAPHTDSLPQGLEVSESGVVSGRPAGQARSYEFRISVTDSVSVQTDTMAFSMLLAPRLLILKPTSSLRAQADTEFMFEAESVGGTKASEPPACGADPPVFHRRWSIVAFEDEDEGVLEPPPWLKIDECSGVLSGLVPASPLGATPRFKVRVEIPNESSHERVVVVEVNN